MDGTLFHVRHAPPPPPADVLAAFVRRELGRGEALYRAGDVADTVCRVERGLLKLSIDVLNGKERIVGVAGPGDLIGALAPGVHVLRESAEALSASVVVGILPRDQARQLEPALFRAAGEQLARVTDALEDGELPVDTRLARTFLRLGDRFGQLSDDGLVRLTLPLTHDNFAAMVGAARETTTAVLGQLRGRGLVAGTRGRYQFRREPLRDFAAESALA